MGIALKDIIGWILVLGLSAGGSYTAARQSNVAAIAKIDDENRMVNIRVARLEEAISTLKSQQAEIRQDIKEVLKLLK